MFTAILALALPAVLTHAGVVFGVPALAGWMGTRAATAVVGVGAKAAAGGVQQLLQHIHDGGQVTPEHRAWIAANHEALFAPPKFQPGQEGPAVWSTPRA